MNPWLEGVLLMLCLVAGCYCAYRYGLARGGERASLPEVVDARFQAAKAEREMWDITRRAFEAMAEKARER